MDRILGFDIQTFYMLILQLFNVVVLCYVISRILYKPVTEFLKNRKLKIENSIKAAEESLKEAQNMKNFYEKKLKSINEECNKIIEDAKIRASNLESKILEEAKQEANIIKDRAMASIKIERENAVNDMKTQIIDISSLIAERYISCKIDEDMQNKLFDEVISDLGDSTWIS